MNDTFTVKQLKSKRNTGLKQIAKQKVTFQSREFNPLMPTVKVRYFL